MSQLEYEFRQALERGRRFELEVPACQLELKRRWLTPKVKGELPKVISIALHGIQFPKALTRCRSIHLRVQLALKEFLQCEVAYTIGWVLYLYGSMFQFDDQDIAGFLNATKPSGPFRIHTWLTLPSLEIIDVALPTKISVLRDIPSLAGRVVARHPAEMNPAMHYKPMLVGDDFFYRIDAVAGSNGWQF